eukprot:CCRYP_010190-RA/>CCRYP_010190-RA protein AED:0.35 eAED:0.35 QI:17/1/1/1/0/0/2/542/218
MFNGSLKIRVFESLITAFLVHLVGAEAGLALSFQAFVLGFDLRHHPLDVRVSGVQSGGEFESFVGSRNISVGHLLIAFADVSGHSFATLKFGQVLLHLFQVSILRVNGESTLQGFDAPFQIVFGFQSRGQSEVTLNECLICLNAPSCRFFHLIIILQFFEASGHVGPIGWNIGVDRGGFFILCDGGGVLSIFKVFIAFGFKGFSFGVRHFDGYCLIQQ